MLARVPIKVLVFLLKFAIHRIRKVIYLNMHSNFSAYKRSDLIKIINYRIVTPYSFDRCWKINHSYRDMKNNSVLNL